MGDDATVQFRPRMTPVATTPGDLGDLGHRDKKPALRVRASDAFNRFSRTRGDADTPRTGTPPGTALERKKSYHPELRPDCPPPGADRGELFVLPRDVDHKMELIHLNRTCTSVDLAQSHGQAARRASGTDCTDEERVHRVRHQVSFAQDVGAVPGGPGQSFKSEDLVSAMERQMRRAEPPVQDDDSDQEHADDDDEEEDEELDDDEEGVGVLEDSLDQASFALLGNASKLSPDGEIDYLAVRPSLASTQLNEIKGPN